jgi:hypothetical protein
MIRLLVVIAALALLVNIWATVTIARRCVLEMPTSLTPKGIIL